MITTIRRLCNLVVLLLLFIHSNSQDLRSFNQNASGSNHSRALSISISPVYSSSTSGNKDSLLFRGSGSGFRVGGDYFFGKAGIGFNTGFSSSSANDAAINNFLKNKSVPQDQMLITKARQQNMYLLLGPTVRFGNKIEINAHAKGGIFINNGGLVNIQQKGAIRAAYRNESTDKNIYPGFLTGLSVQYKTKSDVWSFGIGADYMNTRSEVNNYDARRGNGIEAMKLSGNIQDIVAGISVHYNIFSPRDRSSGQSTGRLLPTVNKRETAARDAQSGLSTGKTYQPGKPVYGNITDKEENNASCGPVTKKITNEDGTTEEMTFSCPADALAYERQTPKRDFGDRMKAGLAQNETRKTFSAPHVLEQKGIISGTLTWVTSNNGGIISNAVINSSPRSGSTTMNSQNSSTRTTNQSSFGTMVRLSARDAGSGMATGRKSRDAASGLATGRQYEPIFIEGQDEVCNPCLATAKMSAANSNPMYKDNGMSGTNPLYNNDKRLVNADEDCNGVADADIYLINAESNEVVAKTRTEQCGDFFFANVPEGNYVVRVSAVLAGKKGYDVYLKSKTDLLGAVSQSDDWMQLAINTSTGDNNNAQKAGISTSRSNLRTKSISIIEADLDGDGEYESMKVLAELNNGTTKDITANSRMNNAGSIKKVTVRGWDPEKKQAITGSANASKEFTISIDDDNGVLLTTQRENGTKEETRATAKVSHHSNVVQFIIPLNDDGSNAGERVKTKSNIKNDRVAAGDVNDDGANVDGRVKTKSNIKNDRVIAADLNDDGINARGGKITKSRSNIQNNRMINDGDDDGIWSPRSNIKMIRVAAGDVNGDGTPDIIGGNLRTEFAVIRDRLKGHFETGDIPTEQQRTVGGSLPGGSVISSAMKPGNPIGGLTIKGGRNPGGNLRTIQTNENGEFEFPNLDAGDYTFTIEQKLLLDDETYVTVGGDEEENIVTGEYNSKDVAVKKDRSAILDSKNNGKTLTEDQANSNVAFRWTPLVPKPKEPVTYRLRVWQLMQGQNATQALKNQPVVEKEVTDQTETSVQGLYTGPCKPPYLCDFIWNVQAFNAAGNPIGNTENTGGGRFSVAQSASIDSKNDGKAITEDQAKSNVAFRWTPLVPKPKEPVTYRLRVWQLMQGQNGTQALKNQPVVEKEVTDQTETSVQGILTGPCKPPYLCDFIWSVQAFNAAGNPIGNTENTDGGRFNVTQSSNEQTNTTKAQNNNTVRSNRTELKSIIIEADLDGDGQYETDVTNKLSDQISLDGEGNVDATAQQKAGVSTSRSNIRSRAALVDKGDGIFVTYARASVNDKDVDVKIVYKKFHDMQMSAIRNLK